MSPTSIKTRRAKKKKIETPLEMIERVYGKDTGFNYSTQEEFDEYLNQYPALKALLSND